MKNIFPIITNKYENKNANISERRGGIDMWGFGDVDQMFLRKYEKWWWGNWVMGLQVKSLAQFCFCLRWKWGWKMKNIKSDGVRDLKWIQSWKRVGICNALQLSSPSFDSSKYFAKIAEIEGRGKFAIFGREAARLNVEAMDMHWIMKTFYQFVPGLCVSCVTDSRNSSRLTFENNWVKKSFARRPRTITAELFLEINNFRL